MSTVQVQTLPVIASLRGQRTSRPWSDDEKTIAVFMAPNSTPVEIGEAIDRSPTAVEFYLGTQGVRALPMPSLAVRGRGRPPADEVRSQVNDAAHIEAVFRECEDGFTSLMFPRGAVYAATSEGLRRLAG